MENSSVGVAERRASYLTITGTFLGVFATFVLRGRRPGDAVRPFDLAMLGLSTFRLGRMIAYDRVLNPIREPFTETMPDDTGAGETVVAEGSGVRRAIGELISCPICAGTWASAAMVYALHLFPGPTRAFLAIMSAVGIAEVLDAASEAMSWTGQAARKQSSD